MDNKLFKFFIILLYICIILYIYLDSLVWLKYYLYPDYNEYTYIKFNKNKKFSIFNNMNTIYSLKQFYILYPKFDYYNYRNSKAEFFKNKTELDVIYYWYSNGKSYAFLNYENYTNNNPKNILIYPHLPFNLLDGGTTVQYYLASLLDKLGIKVRMHKVNGENKSNILFNNYYENDFDMNNTIVIYCEGIQGNPLNAKYVVRWMLSELGKNVPYAYLNTWNKNELVYYFNYELKFNNNPEKIGNIYKLLTVIYVNPNIKNMNLNTREGYCYTMRKSHYHNKINIIHPNNSFEITLSHTQENYIEIFNKYKYFVSYDPLTFISIIASLCGCISIVYPIEGINKKEWILKGALGEYCKIKQNFNLYGIAYGNSPEELKFAQDTIHLVQEQWNDIKNYESKLVQNFITDINNFNNMQNTIQNNYF